ncbi:MAG: glycerol-3-phosphate dehydrogenase C-terminal domain-containing protein, partial [Pseudomonadota bacterium]|nr:glycerol-3-phosphate dehydrogenase C-terminal domain-containing protein [Pseudomonadota bacterium]
VSRYFPGAGRSWTRTAVLPGGDFNTQEQLATELAADFPWLDDAVIHRFVRSYGTSSYQILEGCQNMADLGHWFTDTLSRREVDYLMTHEWAITPEDLLWRRTKQGLYINPEQYSELSEYMNRSGQVSSEC